MQVSDMFKLAFKALKDRKLRSLLTILGIMIGSAMILALIASSSGLSAGVQAQIEKMGANTLTVSSGRSFGPPGGGGGQSTFQLSQDDVNTIKSFQGVSDVIPYYSRGVTIVLGGTSTPATLNGVDLNVLSKLYKGLSLYDGALPDPYDPSAAVVGYGIAFPSEANGSQLTNVNGMISVTLQNSKLAFLVRGILSEFGSAMFSNIDDTIFISLQAAQILLKTSYFTGLYVITDTPDDVAVVQQNIESYYGTDVRAMSASSMLSSIQSIQSQMTLYLASIGGVSLFVAAVGIVNTMFVSVMERTREIGILKALGYRRKEIMGMFLSEAALTGVIGGILGTLFGYALAYIMGGAFSFSLPGGGSRGPGSFGGGGVTSSPVFTPELIVFSLLFPIGVAVLAGLYPAWRAARMNAVVALKYE